MEPPVPARTRGATRPRAIDNETVRAVLEHGAQMLAIARRCSGNSVDAEDAYQRSVEILITKAPCDDVEQLVPWMATVVRNEALAISRRNARSLAAELHELESSLGTDEGDPAEQLERTLRVDASAEALSRMKVDAARCLLLKAEGHEYTEIAQITGLTMRQIGRHMVEGRRALVKRVDDIESGVECGRIEPLLQKAADGDRSALLTARPHLRHCVHCRAVLRDYREGPKRLAAVVPLGLAIGVHGDGRIFGWLQHAANSLHARISDHLSATQAWTEAGIGAKTAATVAACAALAGGGVAVQHSVTTRPAHRLSRPAVAPLTQHRSAAPAIVRSAGPTPATPAPRKHRRRVRHAADQAAEPVDAAPLAPESAGTDTPPAAIPHPPPNRGRRSPSSGGLAP